MLWLLAGILTFGLAGATALLLGLRGRRIDTHPVCRRCGFDLIGQAPTPSQRDAQGEAPRCSECGANLTRRRAIRIGQRRRRPAIATLGAIALLAALGATGAIGWAAATKFDWNTIKPVWLLASELQSLDPAVAKAATDELRSRLSGNGIAPMRGDTRDTRAAERLARRILAYQADTHRPWNQGAGEIFERMWQMNLLPEEMIHQYVAQSSPVTAHVRARIEQRQPLAVRFDFGQRSGGGGLIEMRAALVDIVIDGKPVPVGSYRISIFQGGSGAPWTAPFEPVVESDLLDPIYFGIADFGSDQPPVLDLEPGTWPLRMRLVVRRGIRPPDRRDFGTSISVNSSGLALPPKGDSLADLARHTGLWYADALPEGLPNLELVALETQIEVIPPGEPAVATAAGPDAELVAKLIIESALLEWSYHGEPELSLTFRKDLPLDIAYDIVVALPDGDRPLGSFVYDVGYGWGPSIALGDTPGVNPGDFLRFTFTPNPQAAARLAGIEQIAGEPFEVELIVPEDRLRALFESSRVLPDPG